MRPVEGARLTVMREGSKRTRVLFTKCFSETVTSPGIAFWRNNSLHRWQAFVTSCSLHSLSQNGPAGSKLCFEGQAFGLQPLIYVSMLSVYGSFPPTAILIPPPLLTHMIQYGEGGVVEGDVPSAPIGRGRSKPSQPPISKVPLGTLR